MADKPLSREEVAAKLDRLLRQYAAPNRPAPQPGDVFETARPARSAICLEK